MFSRFIYVVACVSTSLLFMAVWYSIVCINYILFIHSSIDGHFLAIVNDATMNILVHKSVYVPLFNSFAYIPRRSIAGSYGNYMFNVLKNLQTLFHSGCTILHSHQQCMRVWTSLVVQWLRIHLPMQWTRVRALVWEDPTCHGATKPVRHNC